MNIQIIKGPNGKFHLFYLDAGIWIAENLTEGQVRDWFAIEGAAKADELLEQVNNGERPYGADTLPFEAAASIAQKNDEIIEAKKYRN